MIFHPCANQYNTWKQHLTSGSLNDGKYYYRFLNSSSDKCLNDASFYISQPLHLSFPYSSKETKIGAMVLKTNRQFCPQGENAKVYLKATHQKQPFNHPDQQQKRISPLLIFHLRPDIRWCWYRTFFSSYTMSLSLFSYPNYILSWGQR